MVIFRLQDYFGHFKGFGDISIIFRFLVILVNFQASGLFWPFLRFQGYFGHFLCFGGILVNLLFQGYFGHFMDFGGILVIFRFQGYILVIFWIPRGIWSFCTFCDYFGNF